MHLSHVASTEDLGDAEARDVHGRPLLLIFGILWERAALVRELSTADVDFALQTALTAYRRFLDDEEHYSLAVPQPFPTSSTIETVAPVAVGAAEKTPEPTRLQHGLRWQRALVPAAFVAGTAALVTAAMVYMGGDPEPPPASRPGTVVLHDESGEISVSVPGTWKQDAGEQTWSPAASRVADREKRPVLRASTDPTRFRDPGHGNSGIFIGLTTAKNPVPAAPADHERADNGGCTAVKPRTKTVGSLTFTITRWKGCRVGVPVIDEVRAVDASKPFGAWIRIKQAEDAQDVTDQILDTVRLAAP
ncbi:hypothetical protein ACH35V_15155 [Actinomadura sp. 1N219]|uniref:hypothetical protein n=1 Tax=Actinomadura sp. 1N219 TaxID=3375152 RepID=UPI00378BBB19